MFVELPKKKRFWLRAISLDSGVNIPANTKAPQAMWNQLEQIEQDCVEPLRQAQIALAQAVSAAARSADKSAWEVIGQAGEATRGLGGRRTTLIGTGGLTYAVHVAPGMSENVDQIESSMMQLEEMTREAITKTLEHYGVPYTRAR